MTILPHMKFDLHVHSTLSACSQLTLGEILGNARSMGLDGVCITDHQTMAVTRSVTEGIQEDGLCVIAGMEYATPDGDFLIFGPFHGLAAGLSGRELLCQVDMAGGVAVAAHPFRAGRCINPEIIAQQHCRIIEEKNGRDNGAGQKRAAEWQALYKVGLAGGSDAHSLKELGRTVTIFEEPIRNRQDFIQALKGGRFQAAVNAHSNG